MSEAKHLIVEEQLWKKQMNHDFYTILCSIKNVCNILL